MKRVSAIVLGSAACPISVQCKRSRYEDLAVSDFFGGFGGASLINQKQLGSNYFSLEPQSAEAFDSQGRLGTWVCAGIKLDKVQIKDGHVNDIAKVL